RRAARRLARGLPSSARWRCNRTSPRPATISERCSRRTATSMPRPAACGEPRASAPDSPDALNILGYALLLTGHDAEARALYEKALALQPDFPEALNNLGLLLGRAGGMDRGARFFSGARTRRPDYGEAANNLALVL